MTPETQAAHAWCRDLARRHYENFPVASRLLPARLRRPVAVLYAFARSADDLADEGDLDPRQRLDGLDALATGLDAIEAGATPDGPLFTALADSMRRHRLPLEPLRDLLSAFRQDVTTSRYADFGELMDYCRRSANPVGRLLLKLDGSATPRNLALSDAVCSALQLVNFLQDLRQDADERGRIYLPQDEMRRFGVDDEQILHHRNSAGLRRLLRFQSERAHRLLRSGSPLGRQLRGRFGLEVRAILLGGERVLQRLHRREDAFTRPRLTRRDQLAILWGAFRRGF